MTQNGTNIRSFTYDAAGNITADNRGGTGYKYAYNDRGRLEQFQVGSVVALSL